LLRVVLQDLLCTGHVTLRIRSKLCSLHNGKTLFLPITWLNLRRSAVKVSEQANWGQGFQKCGLFLPLVKGHVTRRMQWLFQIMEMWSDIQYS